MARLPRLSAALLALTLMTACAGNPDRLSSPDRNFYYVIDDDQTQAEYLKLKDSERQTYLEKLGLWQQWLELSGEERDAADTGEVKVGFKEFAAHMAWGLPADERVAEARGRSVSYQTFIRCTSGPKKGKYVRQNLDCDGTSSEVQLAVENGIVTEIKYLD
ncbi:hypothetical protein G6O69_09645 [Pseudenhygromyxa sp. WMMC2535]|uniref:hypothetical protein n=1 Tax=Pseudenhygromyxa sp. WMMC2535 TaxID=2712867 RepID=UPI0015579630|nr:hypothetical protein [Pseudenhygromyxa sp. WMMC2535]NVB38094.1 hypothetical protein [Pseudenhygromyxa sp. WMMC2535]